MGENCSDQWRGGDQKGGAILRGWGKSGNGYCLLVRVAGGNLLYQFKLTVKGTVKEVTNSVSQLFVVQVFLTSMSSRVSRGSGKRRASRDDDEETVSSLGHRDRDWEADEPLQVDDDIGIDDAGTGGVELWNVDQPWGVASTFNRMMLHRYRENEPCGCEDCLFHAVINGAARVYQLPSGRYSPVVIADKIVCVSADEIRQLFHQLNSNTERLSKAFDVNQWRALRYDMASMAFAKFSFPEKPPTANPNKKSRREGGGAS